MTGAELQEMLESLDYDIKSGELCFEDADELARKYTAECLESEIKNMRTRFTDSKISNDKESSARVFIEETKRIQKMVQTANSWKEFIKCLRYHVNHLEKCVHEVTDEIFDINPQDYLDCAEYWLSVLG